MQVYYYCFLFFKLLFKKFTELHGPHLLCRLPRYCGPERAGGWSPGPDRTSQLWPPARGSRLPAGQSAGAPVSGIFQVNPPCLDELCTKALYTTVMQGLSVEIDRNQQIFIANFFSFFYNIFFVLLDCDSWRQTGNVCEWERGRHAEIAGDWIVSGPLHVGGTVLCTLNFQMFLEGNINVFSVKVKPQTDFFCKSRWYPFYISWKPDSHGHNGALCFWHAT